jgi:hypothetical protein
MLSAQLGRLNREIERADEKPFPEALAQNGFASLSFSGPTDKRDHFRLTILARTRVPADRLSRAPHEPRIPSQKCYS